MSTTAAKQVFTLVYFPLRARAESLRMIARYCCLDVQDEIVELEDWPAMKPNTPKGSVPFMRMPDGSLMPETYDIAVFLASLPDVPADRQLLLTSEQKELYALVQGNPTNVLSIFNPLMNWFSKEDSKEKMESYLPPAIEVCRKYDGILGQSGGPFISGTQPGIGDFGLFHASCNMKKLVPTVFDDFSSKWGEWLDAVASLPGVREYLAERPKTGTGKIGRRGSFAADVSLDADQ
eukprot:m.341658 g.341658  ORF g.341658 m.341658 type:complete len:235 (-) comp20330_c0_seq1:37-741(-)